MRVFAGGLLLVSTVAVAGYPPAQYVQDVKDAYEHRIYDARHGIAVGPRSQTELGLSAAQFNAGIKGAKDEMQRRAMIALHAKFEDCMESAAAAPGEMVNTYFNQVHLCEGALADAGVAVLAAP